MTMYHDTRQLFTLVLASGLVSACSGSDSTGLPPTNVGGQSSANGGGSNSGGANGLGGGSPGAGRSSTQGGAPSSGGAPSGGAPAGGAPGTGGVQISGTTATGGRASTGGAGSGGAPSSGGIANGGMGTGGQLTGGTRTTTGGSVAAGGSLATGGSRATGGTKATGGAATGGALSSGGTPASGGAKATGGALNGTGGASVGTCGSTTLNQHPFGCKFAWGMADPGGSLANYSYIQFMSYWVDSSISAAGTYTTCNACNWLKNQVASTNIIPAYYAYIIGFLAHANGIVDGNQTGAKKLTTDGAALVKANRAAIVNAYAWYAQQTAKVWPTKPLVWLLEGDFVQLVGSSQSSPMTYAEVGQLAADITCAIKSNMPNAVVAIDQSSWNDNTTTNNYWAAMANVNYDMVWTTGVGNNNGFIEGTATSSTYNAATATYAYLHKLTGRTILVDTSAGASAAGDSWSTASLADLNARISEGVIAANITGTAPVQSNITSKSGLDAIPACP